MPNYGDFEIEENDELGIDPHLALQGGFDDELGALASGSSKAHNAAVSLRDYLVRTNNFGSDNNKVPEIAAYQRDMGMGSSAIGIVGPRTRARATELSVTLPEKRTNSGTSNNTAKEAAGKLRDYLLATNSFGSETHRDETVKSYQQQMGMAALGVKKFGIVGPLTRQTAKKYGVILPQPKPENAPVIVAPSKAPTPGEAAIALKKYLERTSDFGSRKKPSATVKQYQRYMGLIKSADGIVGPITNERAQSYGVTLPPRPDNRQASLNKTRDDQTANRNANRKAAAVSLRDYLTKTNDFGAPKHRSTNVATYQRGMGMGANAIGIVGPRTRALAHVLGVTLPAKTASHVTNKPTNKITKLPEQKIAGRRERKPIGGGSTTPLWTYAEGLRRYLVSSGDFGTKKEPSAKVAEFQTKMQQLTADGIVGRKTRARADGLLKHASIVGKWPAGTPTSLPPRPTDGKRRELKPITKRGRDRVRRHVDDAFKTEQQKAKEKLQIIDKLSDAYPDIPIWDTYKWRKRVIDLLKVAAGGKC